jgi:penicillin amidase
METFEEAAQYLAQKDAPPVEAEGEVEGAAEGEVEAAPEGEPADAPVSDEAETLEQISLLLNELEKLSAIFGDALGSNSWVVSGDKTESGMPILANDPHIGFTNPSIWYEAHMTYPGYDTYGYHLALIPFALLGHNRHHAWALTMFANDDVDMFVEKFQEDDPSKVMYKGEWTDALVEEGTIKVRFDDDATSRIRVTPHGPVVTDLLRTLMGYEGPDVSLSWVWQHLDYTDMKAFYLMGKAQSYEEFEEGVSLVTSPGVNVSYADANGNIAWWAAGRVPIRPDHVNSKRLLDGASGEDELLGYVPFEENPHLKNPPWGYIVTANNKSTVKPVGAVDDLEGYWQPWDRAARIEELLEAENGWNVDKTRVAQFDDKAWFGPEVVGAIVETLTPLRDDMTDLEQEALAALAAWDYTHPADSVGASIHWAFHEQFMHHALADEMGDQLLAVYDTLADSFNFYKYGITQPDLPFWDDVNSDARETYEDIVSMAFSDAVTTLTAQYGPSVEDWRWGDVHTMTFRHPFGYLPWPGTIFNIGPFEATGSHHVVNNMIANGSDAQYEVVAGPSTRRVIDFGNLEESYAILPTGNSGHFLSPNYDDQAEMFMCGDLREVVYTEEQIAASTAHTLVLKPSANGSSE